MSTIALMIATAAACGLPMLYLHAQLYNERSAHRVTAEDRDRYKSTAEQLSTDNYALRRALTDVRRMTEPCWSVQATDDARSWGEL